MRRSDRLFQIVHHLQRRRVTTAARLAQVLGVSERTIYRDIRDLSRSGIPIAGEAGVGYALPPGFELPPMMFTQPELEALVLGIRAVNAWGDEALSAAATSALARIEATIPRALRAAAEGTALFAPKFHVPTAATRWLEAIRNAIARRTKMILGYVRSDGERSRRIVWPLGLFFWGHSWSLIAYCELRQGFRNFRLDRIEELTASDESFQETAGRTLADFLASVAEPAA